MGVITRQIWADDDNVDGSIRLDTEPYAEAYGLQVVVDATEFATLNPAQFFDGTRILNTTTGVEYVVVNKALYEPASTAPTWTALTLVNSWVAQGFGWAVPGYCKVGNIVYLRGLAKGGARQTVMGTLPVGFRPSVQMMMLSIIAENATTIPAGEIHVMANGDVRFWNPTTFTFVSLDGVSFPVA